MIRRILVPLDGSYLILIAMSTHGRSGLGRLLFGSVADRVLREASVPVLLVTPGEAGREEVFAA